MKTSLLCALCVLILSSCSYKINRTGYQASKSNLTSDCDIVIKKYAAIDDSMQKLGEIRLKDSGFTVSCSEADAIKLLKKEGCALNANLINITDEYRMDIKSTCYRCTAHFYRVKTDSTLVSDARFAEDKIETRSKNDKKRTNAIIWSSILAGLVAGIVVGLMSQ